MFKMARRGVLMSSKKERPAWQERLPRDGDSDAEEDSEDEDQAKIRESHEEWTVIEREAREELRLKYAERSFTGGRRDAEVAAYDDAVSDEDEPEAPRPPREEADGEEHSRGDGAVRDRDRSVSPPAPAFRGGAASSGDQTRKRGGRKPGSKKRKKEDGEEGEEGEQKEKKKRKKDEDEDPERWLKLRLSGEEKPKRIDATRVVSYYDFDTSGALFRDTEPDAEVAAEAEPPPAGNFRASVSLDMWGEDSDDDGP